MLTKTILFAILAATCGVTPAHAENIQSAAPDEPDIRPPGDDPKEQLFCCETVDPKTASGEGCKILPKEHILLCQTILACGDVWTLHDGKAACGK
ncbi:hypothetical protein DB30_07240 [Enhygromyxa salina]|uniref:Kazal-like domain-containing protein n=1 Tax=Enhygromyxa salina TaxID=215803 RepID=A0A0C1ZN55_9BACT|nr:hypothetical protein [Enhygromyxa salina]KIG18904.1 hypothetical protein DB30_07240 [Enhygromyxa salina]